jgi:outer membrane cobalamin receptor
MKDSEGDTMLGLVRRGRFAACCWLSFVALISGTALSTRAAAVPCNFDIAAGSAADTLREFGKQAKMQTLFNYSVVKDLRTRAVAGSFEPEDALTRMLAATGLTFERVGERTFAIRAAKEAEERIESAADAVGYQPTRQPPIDLDEIVITGSHIRGVQTSASPVLHFERADIEASGRASTEEFIQHLPQNFSGGSTVTTAAAIRGGEGYANNFGQGTGANLRGLGNTSTLVLLNGRRLAPIGAGTFVDLSLIPLSAIERIDVLTDGASAVYGSDAVGGVVNLITRKQFDGAQTLVRYGSVTDGSRDEKRVGQLFGTHWSSGSALMSYDYQDSSALSSNDRYPDTTPNDQVGAVQLLPPDRRRGALLSLTQDAGASAHLYLDALYSKRDTRSDFFSFADQTWDSHVQQYGGTLGGTANPGGTWQADIAASSSKSEMHTNFTFGSNAPTSRISSLQVSSFDAKADGALFALPGGAARLAVGGHYRHETYDARSATSITTELSRDVRAAFGELLVPFVGAENARVGVQRLELTVAGRYEEYSDFGTRIRVSSIKRAGRARRPSWPSSTSG